MMKLYAFLLHGSEGALPKRKRYDAEDSALEMQRETAHCRCLSDAPQGPRDRFNKSEESRFQRSKHGFYMFGRDASQLTGAWNCAVGVSE